MAKYKCLVCGKNSESEYCFSHKPRKSLKSGKKLVAKTKTIEQKEENQEAIDKMWELFWKVWKQRGPYSELSNTYLGSEPLSYMFDHLLPKETFPEVMYEEWNILMVTLDEHTNRHNGFPTRAHKEAIERAKEIYNSLFSKY